MEGVTELFSKTESHSAGRGAGVLTCGVKECVFMAWKKLP